MMGYSEFDPSEDFAFDIFISESSAGVSTDIQKGAVGLDTGNFTVHLRYGTAAFATCAMTVTDKGRGWYKFTSASNVQDSFNFDWPLSIEERNAQISIDYDNDIIEVPATYQVWDQPVTIRRRHEIAEELARRHGNGTWGVTYATSASLANALLKYGNWNYGFKCDDFASPLTAFKGTDDLAAWGSGTFVTAAGSPVFRSPGAIGPDDLGIGLNTTATLTSALALDVSASQDLGILMVWRCAPGEHGAPLLKKKGGGDGWALTWSSPTLTWTLDGTVTVTVTVSLGADMIAKLNRGMPAILLASLSRESNTANLAVMLADGTSTIGTEVSTTAVLGITNGASVTLSSGSNDLVLSHLALAYGADACDGILFSEPIYAILNAYRTSLFGSEFDITDFRSELEADILDVSDDTQNIRSRLPAALTFAGNMKSDALAVSGDTVAADNMESMFDGTGYRAPTGPVMQRQLFNATAPSTILSSPPHARTLTTGTEVNTFSFVGECDGFYHDILDTAGTLDLIYWVYVGIVEMRATSVWWKGRLVGSANVVKVYARNFGSAIWQQIGTINGTDNSDDEVAMWPMQMNHFDNTRGGYMEVRFAGTGLSSATLKTDAFFLNFGPWAPTFESAPPARDCGIPQSATNTTITLSTVNSSATDDFYNGKVIHTTSNSVLGPTTRSGQYRRIIDYVGATRVATIDRAWDVNPTTADKYIVFSDYAPDTNDILRRDLATAGAAGTITLDASASSTDDYFKGAVIYIIGGTGALQAPRRITGYGGFSKVATVSPNWATTPDSTSRYMIMGDSMAVDAIAVSGDTTAADNLELQFDGTGLTGNTFPATQSALADAQTSINSIQNNTRCVRSVPSEIEVPAAGSRTYRIELFLYDEVGNMEAPDAAPTIALVNQAGTSRAARLDSATMTLVSAGYYRAIYTSTAGDTLEQLKWSFSVTEGAVVRSYGNDSALVEVVVVDDASTIIAALMAHAHDTGVSMGGLFKRLESWLTGQREVLTTGAIDHYSYLDKDGDVAFEGDLDNETGARGAADTSGSDP